MEENLPEGLAVFDLPAPLRKRLRTSNSAENLNKQLKRRIKVASVFPNEASLLRLVSAVLMEISEKWKTGRSYLKSSLFSRQPLQLNPKRNNTSNLALPTFTEEKLLCPSDAQARASSCEKTAFPRPRKYSAHPPPEIRSGSSFIDYLHPAEPSCPIYS